MSRISRVVAELYEKTEDAMLVESHFGHELGSLGTAGYIGILLLRPIKDEILALAKKKQVAYNKRNGIEPEAGTGCCQG